MFNCTYEELLKNRRSIRDYKDKKIDQEILREILNNTCQAPSAMNLQPWNFIIIQDKNLMKKISDESKRNLLGMKKYEQLLHDRANVFYNAPCLVIIAGENKNEFFERDCALAAAYFMFAATARGLGTCWIGLGGNITDAALKQEINLPKDYKIVATLIIGYPQKIPEENKRYPKVLSEIGFSNK